MHGALESQAACLRLCPGLPCPCRCVSRRAHLQAAAASDVKPARITVPLRTPPATARHDSDAAAGTSAVSVDLTAAEIADAGPCDDAAVSLARRIYCYCKRFGHGVGVVVGEVHSAAEARAVVGVDAVRLPPRVFQQLSACPGALPLQVQPLPAAEPCPDEVRGHPPPRATPSRRYIPSNLDGCCWCTSRHPGTPPDAPSHRLLLSRSLAVRARGCTGRAVCSVLCLCVAGGSVPGGPDKALDCTGS